MTRQPQANMLDTDGACYTEADSATSNLNK